MLNPKFLPPWLAGGAITGANPPRLSGSGLARSRERTVYRRNFGVAPRHHARARVHDRTLLREHGAESMEGGRVCQLRERLRCGASQGAQYRRRCGAGRRRAEEICAEHLRQDRRVRLSSLGGLEVGAGLLTLRLRRRLVLAKFTQTIVRCRPITQIGAEQVRLSDREVSIRCPARSLALPLQILLDLQGIKNTLLHLVVAPGDTAPIPTS